MSINMKHLINLIITLSLFAQVVNAQKIETFDEYKAFFDSITYRLKIAEKDSSCFIGKPFSEFAKHLDKCGVKILQVGALNFDMQKVIPQNLYGISAWFITNEVWDFILINKLRQPTVFIYFNEVLPYQHALSLEKEYEVYFVKEVEEFYSGATIKSLVFSLPDNLSMFPHRKAIENESIIE